MASKANQCALFQRSLGSYATFVFKRFLAHQKQEEDEDNGGYDEHDQSGLKLEACQWTWTTRDRSYKDFTESILHYAIFSSILIGWKSIGSNQNAWKIA